MDSLSCQTWWNMKNIVQMRIEPSWVSDKTGWEWRMQEAKQIHMFVGVME